MRALRRRKRSRSRGRKGVVRPLEKTVSFLRYAEGAEGEGSVLEQGRGSLLEQRGGFDQMGREGGRIIVERGGSHEHYRETSVKRPWPGILSSTWRPRLLRQSEWG